MIRLAQRLLLVWAMACPSVWAALAPHEIVLLVNENSQRSLEVANHYASLRNVPARNIIRLALPPSVLKPGAEMNEAEFLQHIWVPANEEMLRRGIGDHVLAWIYSADFPVRINREKGSPVSLTGITFVRNELPDDQLVTQGKYTSPLFLGPQTPQDRVKLAESFDSFSFKLGGRMPLPSMMLTHTGTRGLGVGESVDILRRGAASDATRPLAPVIFVKRDDVRSKCRDWQFPAAVSAISSLRGEAKIVDGYPDAQKGLMGLFDGIHEVVPTPGFFLPGSVAEHLTSHAANFSDFNQSKLSVWLRAGATASSGAVVEPFALGSKFASPFLFAHYLSGCSIIESYYLSVQCPLQLLMVGEPLAAPWADRFFVTLAGLDPEGPLKGKATFYADAGIHDPRLPPRIQYFLDGVLLTAAPPGPMLALDTLKLSDGYHALRAVVRRQGPVAVQSYDEKGIVVNNRGRAVNLAGISAGDKVDLHHARRVLLSATGAPRETGLACGELRIPLENGSFHPAILGAGPVQMQAYAVYDDGMEVRSEPVPFEILPLNRPPVISSLARSGSGSVAASADDPEGDPVNYSWYCPVDVKTCSHADGTVADGVFTPNADQPFSVCIFDDEVPKSSGVSAELMVPPGRAGGILLHAFLLFDVQDGRNFSYFGASGETGAWTIGVCRDGKLSPLEAYGAAIPYNTWIGLSVRQREDGILEAFVNGERVCVSAMQKPGWSGKYGLLVQQKPLKFRNLAACIQDGGEEIQPDRVREAGWSNLILRVDDGFNVSEENFNLVADENRN